MEVLDLKDIALKQKHIDLGAKIVPFAGFNMPLQYTGLTDEHLNVRNNVGIFDVSHMGEFMVKGEGALELINRITSNDASVLVPGKVQYSCFPNYDGGIVDDLLVYMLAENEYMLVVNGANLDKDWAWVEKHNTNNVDIKNVSDNISLLAVQGPNAQKMLAPLTNMDLDMVYYTVQKGIFAGVNNVIVSSTGYTGAGGFEIYFDNANAEKIFDAVLEAGKAVNAQMAGLACRDTLRLEMGFCLYGNDINDETSPIEAGLGWITKFTKDFVNADFLKNQKENGVSKKLVGFELIDRGIPRHDYEIVDADGNNIGIVTSGTMAPSLNKAIGMGYVKTEFAKAGSEIYISIRNKNIKAQVVKMPFYKG
ncbi:glycine cleavage system aminomethyltransferase GcvT [Vicingus serpentipes]|uniref:Aminomethyltransferase n=1 Tax=Vicingus serpentipes TaxID=1926625 RepID=A0A5C6RUJ0_9FLAO|nr:glycine cleavage system aminomethyltransferase GcvT [Vicingus serpentipes]TXB65913.1 glycine cleavage system aminomethyltransferase GcvT [Vicingus serpentipes]